jgi:hypothetical protein
MCERNQVEPVKAKKSSSADFTGQGIYAIARIEQERMNDRSEAPRTLLRGGLDDSNQGA